MTTAEHHTPASSQPKEAHKPLSWPVIASSLALVISIAGFSLSAAQWGGAVPLLGQKPQTSFELAANTGSAKAHGLMGSPSLVADVAEAIAPSVVNIDVKKVNRNAQAMPMPFGDDIFERFFGFSPRGGGQGGFPQPMNPVIRGNGSGVIISSDGDVLTNNHVVNGAEEIVVTLNDGRKFDARVAGRDPFSDIALLKMQGASGLKPAHLGNSKILRPGEWVIAVGSPLGFDHTVTLGIVSALSRQVPDINTNVEFIQTDAAINPGNSGGPLVNLNGEVIGINTAIAGQGQNIGFAIPIDTARKIAQDLMTAGKVTRPWIGISMGELSPQLTKSLGMPETTQGVIVAQVVPGSPAAKAGFQQGDIIQRVNGQSVTSSKAVQEYVRNKPVKTELNFQILRNGQMNAVTLRTEVLPESVAQQQARPEE